MADSKIGGVLGIIFMLLFAAFIILGSMNYSKEINEEAKKSCLSCGFENVTDYTSTKTWGKTYYSKWYVECDTKNIITLTKGSIGFDKWGEHDYRDNYETECYQLEE